MEKDASEIAKLTERILKDPKSKLFVPLAEEYKKIGQVDMAVTVLTEGLKNNPGYATARSFLGRLLLDQGNLAGAQKELEEVVKAIPDNLLAQKKLGDIFILLGKPGEALARYKAALALNAADKELTALVADLETGKDVTSRIPKPQAKAVPPETLKPSAAPAAAMPPAAALPPKAPGGAPPPPAAAVPKPVAAEKPPAAPATPVVPAKPVAAVQEVAEAVEEIVEIESLDQAAAQEPPKPSPIGPVETLPPLKSREVDIPGVAAFDLSETAAAVSAAPEAPSWGLGEQAPEPAGPAEVVSDDINTDTLAELYIAQGFYDKAIEIYQRMLSERPDNVALQKKLLKLHALAGGPTPAAMPFAAPQRVPAPEVETEQKRMPAAVSREELPEERKPLAVAEKAPEGFLELTEKAVGTSAAVRRKETIDRLESWLTKILKEKKA